LIRINIYLSIIKICIDKYLPYIVYIDNIFFLLQYKLTLKSLFPIILIPIPIPISILIPIPFPLFRVPMICNEKYIYNNIIFFITD